MRRSQRVPGLPNGRSALRVRVLKYLALAVALLAMMAAGKAPQQSANVQSANVNDFVEYWSAAHQMREGRDPYAKAPLLAWERQVDPARSEALVMRNAPWTLLVIAPFAWLPFAVGQQIWLGLGLATIAVSARWLWTLYQIQGEAPWIASLSTGLFLPIAVALVLGQISPLVLFGIVGFLRFENEEKYVWAGAFLFLAALKPHLVFLFWVALLLWSVRRRNFRVLGTLAAVTVAASVAVTLFDHRIFNEYWNFLRSGAFTELTPTPGGLLRSSLHSGYALQSLPAVLAAGWFFWHWRRSGAAWEWRREMPLLSAISLLTVPYAFFFDQVILLPCVFQGAAWAGASRRLAWGGVALLYLATNTAVLALILFHRTAFWYVWTAPAWFLLYLIARAIGGGAGSHREPA